MKNLLFLPLALFFVSCGGEGLIDRINDDSNVFFKSIEITHGSLNAWDQFDSPDMQLRLFGESESYEFEVKYDVQELPVTWHFEEQSIRASDYRWRLEVADIDLDGEDQMISISFNPFLKLIQIEKETVSIFDRQWEIKVTYEF